MEIWKKLDFINFSNYEISNKGNLRNVKTEHNFIIRPTQNGYVRLSLTNDNGLCVKKMVHILVAMAFLSNIENKPSVNHKDKNRSNNDISNLEWATWSEQVFHRGTNLTHSGNPIYQLDENLIILKKWNKIIDAAIFLNLDKKAISHACRKGVKYNNYYWKFDYNVDIIENEIWKPIPLETKDIYFASNYGRIKTPTGKITSGFKSTYCDVELKFKDGQTKGKRVHILVALAFLEFIENKPYINHKDGNKYNNKLENLEYVSQSENILHAYKNGLIGENKHNNKSTPIVQLTLNGEYINRYSTVILASKENNIGNSSIINAINGYSKSAGGFLWIKEIDYNNI